MADVFEIGDDVDIDRYLSAHPDFVECRADSHTWRRLHTGHLITGRGSSLVWQRQAECDACGMKRIKRWDADRQRLPTQYVKPDDYYVKGGRISKDRATQYMMNQQEQRKKRRR